jgi:hypothetical protein
MALMMSARQKCIQPSHCRNFRNKKREYPKGGKKNNDINEFQEGYQPKTILGKYENTDLLADSCNILKRWKNYFCQLLNLHGIHDVRQTEIHTADSLVLNLLVSRMKLLLI